MKSLKNLGLHYNTVSTTLLETLQCLMKEPTIDSFRLVGGTALSLQLGHRMSVDIDLFSDASYNSIDFNVISECLKRNFKIVESSLVNIIGTGTSYFVGQKSSQLIKLDIYYTDNFVFDLIERDNVRMASVQEIAAMKIEVISQDRRKKDFWDIHELLNQYTLTDILEFHKKRYPFSHDRQDLLLNLNNFNLANDDWEPVCLRSKSWDIIRLDLIEAVSNLGK